MKNWRNVWASVAIVAALQTAVLGWMVVERITLLKNGQEVVLPIVPVDPRSLFRGDYVILSYQATRVPGGLIEGRLAMGEPVYITLKKEADGNYAPIAASRSHPGTAGPDEVILLGRVQHDARNNRLGTGDIFVRYGIESYFVPEGKGLELEKLAQDQKLSVVVAVDRHGNSAIKGLIVNGQRAYEEPLIW